MKYNILHFHNTPILKFILKGINLVLIKISLFNTTLISVLSPLCLKKIQVRYSGTTGCMVTIVSSAIEKLIIKLERIVFVSHLVNFFLVDL